MNMNGKDAPKKALSAMPNDELLAGLEAKYQEYLDLLPLVKELQEELAYRQAQRKASIRVVQ